MSARHEKRKRANKAECSARLHMAYYFVREAEMMSSPREDVMSSAKKRRMSAIDRCWP